MKVFDKEKILSNPEKFVSHNRKKLIGGSVFTSGSNIISRLISKFTKKGNDDFTPSHVGQIIKINDVIYVFDMKPPVPKITEIHQWIREQKDDFKVILRPYDIDADKFSINVIKRANKRYPFWSAIQCLLKINYELPTPKDEDEAIAKKAEHCSEITIVEYQKCGYFKDINANKATPESVFELFKSL